MDSLAQTPSSPQPSPALSPHLPFSANQEMVANGNAVVRDTPSESDSSPPLDYLLLSQCETGRKCISRCDSMSNSELSFEQSSLETMSEDVFISPAVTDPSPSPFSSAPLLSAATVLLRLAVLRSRTSLSGLELYRREFELSTKGHWNKRLSLNLPILLPTAVSESQSEDSYVPMASPTVSSSDAGSDGYIPMSPTIPASLLTNGKAESPLPPVPDMEPPPVNRKLKPRIRVRPPPLDLRGLSTIREFPTHYPLIRTMTEPSASAHCIPLDRRWGWGLNGSEQEGVTPMTLMSGCDSAPWFRRSHLDYLSLDFNSASPSPVQKKPLLDEQRVDYVQVDEKKTQALQNTRTEWKDQRQSKSVTPGREEPGQRTEN
ncbi:hypothetical protein AOLI_G00272320 [Acnodon oligacanthus]